MWLMTFEVFYLKLVLNIISTSPAQTILELIRHDYMRQCYEKEKKTGQYLYFLKGLNM